MKVNGTGPNSTRDVGGSNAASSTSKTKRGSSTSKAPQIESGVEDKVAISSRAKDSAKAKEIAASSPDIDEAKVARLKSAIQNGSYKVDSDKVAERLVDEHLMSAF
jgi:negative regulator of flagellin synthesis FlgM